MPIKIEVPSNTSRGYNSHVGLQQYGIRIFLLFLAFSTASSALFSDSANPTNQLVVGFFAIYSLSSFFWTINTKRPPSESANEFLSLLDALVIGIVITSNGIYLFPVALFYSMLTLSNLLNYGSRKWLNINLYYFGGLTIGGLIADFNWAYYGSIASTIACIIGLVAYVSAYAYFSNKHILGLLKINTRLREDSKKSQQQFKQISQYLTPTIWESIKADDDRFMKTGRKRITVFFSDIKGFSSLAEEIESETLTYILDDYLTEMSIIATKHRGTIDKFMGDGIMILFGDSKKTEVKDDALRAAKMALDMRSKMKELRTRWFNKGIKKPLQIRMGINTGFCTVGTFGTSDYRDYTALGVHVNLASRLESAAEEGQILISHETWSLIKNTVLCQDKSEIKVKGFSYPIKVYQIVDLRKKLGKAQSYFEQTSEGFSMHMDLEKIKSFDKPKLAEYLEEIANRVRDH